MSEITYLADQISSRAYTAAVEGKSSEEILQIGTPLLERIIVDSHATRFDIRMARIVLDNIVGIYATFAERKKYDRRP